MELFLLKMNLQGFILFYIYLKSTIPLRVFGLL